MASLIQAKRSSASKCWLVVAAWIVAAVVAGNFNLMQYTNLHRLQSTPRTRTSVRARGGSGFSVDPDEPTPGVDFMGRRSQRMDYHKMKTQQEQIEDTLAGVAAGGATAVMLLGSTAVTISALRAWSLEASESNSPSAVVVPSAQEEVSSTPLRPKAVEALAPEAGGGMMAAIKARAESMLAELESRTVTAPAVVKSPIKAAPVQGSNAAPKKVPHDDMISYYGFQRPNCLYSGRH